MKRDLAELVKQSTESHPSKGCPFSHLEGDAAVYAKALTEYPYEHVNKLTVRKLLLSEFGVTVPEKRVYDHFRGSCEC